MEINSTYDKSTRAGRSDTVGSRSWCRKSGVESVASRGVGSPVSSSDASTLFEKLKMSSSYDRVFYFF